MHQLYLDVISVVPLRKESSKRKRAHISSSSGDGETQKEGIYKCDFSREDLQLIRELALSPHCVGLILATFCTTIFGHDLIKMGLLLGLFGGSSTEPADGVSEESSAHSFHARSDIHVLVVGDPGLGKSQMLRAAATVAPRSVMVCGNTSSAAGLTVSVVKEPGGGGDVCLEAGESFFTQYKSQVLALIMTFVMRSTGALVLADHGVCCIDELDKMTCDYHSLLEAMEQQRISIAKSGVVTSMSSRATILAAANPAGGCYERRKSVWFGLFV